MVSKQDPFKALGANKMWKKGIEAARLNAKASKIVSLLKGEAQFSWRSLSQVGVSGIDAAMDHKSPLMRRVLWSVVLFICFSLMLAQILPINVKEAAVNISQLVGTEGMLTSTQIWTDLALNRKLFITECWFGRGVSCDEIGNWTLVHTTLGPCFLFEMESDQINVTGTFNNLYLRFEDTSGSQPLSKTEAPGVRVVLHERDDSPVLLVRTQSIAVDFGWSRDVKMELRKFKTLDTARTPCLDDPGYSEARCHALCFQTALNALIKCRLPFMSIDENDAETNSTTTSKDCSNPDEFEEASATVEKMLFYGAWGVHDCNCELECRETTFLTYPESFAYKPKSIRMRIFYNELVFEQIEEEFAYTVIALLCDIGGTLGLLMGASLLTVCELLEVAWSRALRVCCRQKPKDVEAAAPKEKAKVAKVEPLHFHRQKSATFERTELPLFNKKSLKALEDEYFGDRILF